MSGVLGRRRQYRRSHSPRITPGTLMRGDRELSTWQNVLACGAVFVVCTTLIVAIWVAASQEIRRQQDKATAHGETVSIGQANLLAEAARQELNTIDQSLTILQAAWNSNPDRFQLKSWQSRMPALTDVADDIFIANDQHLIVQDVLPQAVGQGIGAAYVSGGNGSLESVLAAYRAGRDPGLVIGEKAENGILRQYQMYMIRPLRGRTGWLIGASYRSAALVKVFAEGSLGTRGVAALIDTRHGGVQAVAGPAALRPQVNVANTSMYKAILTQNADAGVWIGPTGMDGEIRIHAFRRIPGRDLLVLAGVDEADWMAPADAWAHGARVLAVLGSVLVAGIGGLVLWTLWKLDANRRRRSALEQAAIRLNSAQSVLETAERAAQVGMIQVRTMMASSSDGIALFDADGRLVAWNTPFAAQAGIPPDFVRIGLPLDELLRQQARAGLLGPLSDTETEIARRLAQLRTAQDLSAFTQSGAAGQDLTVRGCSTPDGGVMLILTGLPNAARHQISSSDPAAEATEPATVEQPPVEW